MCFCTPSISIVTSMPSLKSAVTSLAAYLIAYGEFALAFSFVAATSASVGRIATGATFWTQTCTAAALL